MWLTESMLQNKRHVQEKDGGPCAHGVDGRWLSILLVEHI